MLQYNNDIGAHWKFCIANSYTDRDVRVELWRFKGNLTNLGS